MTPLLVYIHGFLSSPQSQKARQVADYIDVHQLAAELQAPALANFPRAAYQQLHELVAAALADQRRVLLVGSSMGGFMATALAEQFTLPAVLVNPSVRPYQHAARFLGDNYNPYTEQHFSLNHTHMDELKAIEPAGLSTPANYLVLLQTDDEVLDYRQAVEYYQGSQQRIDSGGGHRYHGFENQLPAIFTFLGLQPAVE